MATTAPSNTAVWDALAKTDPKHTKGFKRAGGFSGTAIKPIWIVRKLTEQFGPCGSGWGMDKPDFQLVPGDHKELLVFCTVTGWYLDGEKRCEVFGVGGDKVITHIKANEQYKRPERWENDDEAFKKAFTDAVGNAFKFVGVGADVHMGLFEDSKYLAEVAKEYAEPQPEPEVKNRKPVKLDGPYTSKTALWAAVKQFDRELRSCGDVDSLDAFVQSPDSVALLEQCERDFPFLVHGGDEAPPEYEPLYALISKMRTDLEAQENYASPLAAG